MVQVRIGWEIDPDVVGTHCLRPVWLETDDVVKGELVSDKESEGMAKKLMSNKERKAAKRAAREAIYEADSDFVAQRRAEVAQHRAESAQWLLGGEFFCGILEPHESHTFPQTGQVCVGYTSHEQLLNSTGSVIRTEPGVYVANPQTKAHDDAVDELIRTGKTEFKVGDTTLEVDYTEPQKKLFCGLRIYHLQHQVDVRTCIGWSDSIKNALADGSLVLDKWKEDTVEQPLVTGEDAWLKNLFGTLGPVRLEMSDEFREKAIEDWAYTLGREQRALLAGQVAFVRGFLAGWKSEEGGTDAPVSQPEAFTMVRKDNVVTCTCDKWTSIIVGLSEDEIQRRFDNHWYNSHNSHGVKPWEHKGHKPVQHRDGKPRWCNDCGWGMSASGGSAVEYGESKVRPLSYRFTEHRMTVLTPGMMACSCGGWMYQRHGDEAESYQLGIRAFNQHALW